MRKCLQGSVPSACREQKLHHHSIRGGGAVAAVSTVGAMSHFPDRSSVGAMRFSIIIDPTGAALGLWEPKRTLSEDVQRGWDVPEHPDGSMPSI